jgi:hypothetical protein
MSGGDEHRMKIIWPMGKGTLLIISAIALHEILTAGIFTLHSYVL